MKYEITGTTKLTALLGSPVSHSISPQMHNESFRLLGLDYVYLAFDIKPEQLREAVSGLKTAGISGFNLTMPLKVHILPYLDELTPAASLAGAVNTVIVQDGRLIGHTTDGVGYMRSVSDAGFDIIGKKMTLLGAGGAATAICVQAALDGVSSIDMFKRPILDPYMLAEGLIVSDIIYNPRETLLMKQAKERGCPCFNGMYMLLYQGAAAFECWTGQEMPTDIIKEKYFS